MTTTMIRSKRAAMQLVIVAVAAVNAAHIRNGVSVIDLGNNNNNDSSSSSSSRTARPINLALSGTATQSCTKVDAQNAIDGDLSNLNLSFTCDDSSEEIWWKVDLTDNGLWNDSASNCHEVSTVVLYNRMDDCCKDRILGAVVDVLGHDEGILASHTVSDSSQARLEIPFHHYGCAATVKITSRDPTTPLHLAEVQVFGKEPLPTQIDMSTIGAVATQSCDYDEQHTADKAIDGNFDGHFESGSLSRTCQDAAWWKVQLPTCTSVSKVTLYNRVDFDQGLIIGSIVSLQDEHGNSLSQTRVPLGDLQIDLDDFEPTDACVKFVKVIGPANGIAVSLAEVEVYDGDGTKIDLTNGQGTATQSCTLNEYSGAEKAIDGNPSGYMDDYSVSHTCEPDDQAHSASRKHAWWQVDIGTNSDECYKVTQVNLFNRADCCQDRILGATVEVLGPNQEILSSSVVEDVDKVITITTPLDETDLSPASCAKTIKVIAPHANVPVQLAEVVVYVKTPFHNLASDGFASQTCTVGDRGANLALNGVLTATFADTQMMHTCPIDEVAWWNVHFSAARDSCAHVSEVVIYNRLDCCQDRLLGATVTVYGTYGAPLESHTIHEVTNESGVINLSFDLKDHCAKGVKITSASAGVPIHLRQVQVFGTVTPPPHRVSP